MRLTMPWVFLVSLVAALLSGCGQSGDKPKAKQETLILLNAAWIESELKNKLPRQMQDGKLKIDIEPQNPFLDFCSNPGRVVVNTNIRVINQLPIIGKISGSGTAKLAFGLRLDAEGKRSLIVAPKVTLNIKNIPKNIEEPIERILERKLDNLPIANFGNAVTELSRNVSIAIDCGGIRLVYQHKNP